MDDAVGPKREHAVRVVLADGDDDRPDRSSVAAAEHDGAIRRIPGRGHVTTAAADRGPLARERERAGVPEQPIRSADRRDPVRVDRKSSQPHHLLRPDRRGDAVAICAGTDRAGVGHRGFAPEVRDGGGQPGTAPRGPARIEVDPHGLRDAAGAGPAVDEHLASVVRDAVDVPADRVVGILERAGVADHDGQPGPVIRAGLDLDSLTNDGFFLHRGDWNAEPEVRRSRRATGVGDRGLAPGACQSRCQDLARARIRRRDPHGPGGTGIAGPSHDDILSVRPVSAVDPADRRRLAGAGVQDDGGETAKGDSSREQ